jgi:hypothetical protein
VADPRSSGRRGAKKGGALGADDAGGGAVDWKMETMEIGQKKAEEDRALMARQMEENERTIAQLRLELQAKDLEGNETNSEREMCAPRWDDRGGGMERGRDRREQWGGGREGRTGPFPKWTFPKFQGSDPGIWFDRCVDYFNVY